MLKGIHYGKYKDTLERMNNSEGINPYTPHAHTFIHITHVTPTPISSLISSLGLKVEFSKRKNILMYLCVYVCVFLCTHLH